MTPSLMELYGGRKHFSYLQCYLPNVAFFGSPGRRRSFLGYMPASLSEVTTLRKYCYLSCQVDFISKIGYSSHSMMQRALIGILGPTSTGVAEKESQVDLHHCTSKTCMWYGRVII